MRLSAPRFGTLLIAPAWTLRDAATYFDAKAEIEGSAAANAYWLETQIR
jgi:hypothetical protein